MNFSTFVLLIALYGVQLVLSVAVTPTNTTCPMGNMDIFLIADPSSYPLLAFLLNSIARFMPCSRRINLLVDSGESYRRVKLWLPPQYGSHHVIRVFPFYFPEDVPVISHFADQHKAGYILQAWAMLWADHYSEDSSSSKFYHYSMENSLRNSIESQEVDYIMFMDTDSLFGMPVTCSTLFDHKGKPFFPAWSIGEQSQFSPSCSDMVGSSCDRSYMAFFPFVYPIRAFPLLRNHIWHRLDAGAPSFNAVFNGWAKHATWKFFSQFVVMGEYLRSQHGDQARQIMCEPGPGNLVFSRSSDQARASPAGSSSQYFAASLSGTWADPLSDSQMCHQYVPPGVHYGWPYQFYLHNSAKAEYEWNYFRGPQSPNSVHPVDRQFTSKFSSKTLSKLAEFVHHGQCLSDHWLRRSASGQNACSLEGTHAVHPMVDLYSSRELNMEVVRATFTHPSSSVFQDSEKQHHSHHRQQRHLRQKDDGRHSLLLFAVASLVSKMPFIGSHPPPKQTSSYSGPQIHHVGTHIHPPVPGVTHSDPPPPSPPVPTAPNTPPHPEQPPQTHIAAPPPRPTHTTHAQPPVKHAPPPPARPRNPGNPPGAFTVRLPPLGALEPDEPMFQGFCSRLNQQLPRP